MRWNSWKGGWSGRPSGFQNPHPDITSFSPSCCGRWHGGIACLTHIWRRSRSSMASRSVRLTPTSSSSQDCALTTRWTRGARALWGPSSGDPSSWDNSRLTATPGPYCKGLGRAHVPHVLFSVPRASFAAGVSDWLERTVKARSQHHGADWSRPRDGGGRKCQAVVSRRGAVRCP